MTSVNYRGFGLAVKGDGFVKGFFLYLLTLVGFLVYTYSQVDLNLTLSSNPFYQSVQQQLTWLGYFNRSLSVSIFVVFLFLLGAFYIYFLRFFRREGSVVKLLLVVGASGLVLLFSYPAFSYDIFNYIFDARILGYYHRDPGSVRPLDFPQDEWIRFMRWTHRASVYPWGWFIVSLVPYFLGFGKFVLTLFTFKFLMVTAYFVTGLLVYKIMRILDASRAVFVTALFSLHPLVLIEALVSSHSDIVMMMFFMMGVWFFVREKFMYGFVFGLISGSIKYITFPASIIFFAGQFVKGKEGKWGALPYITALAIMQAGIFFFWSVRYEFQPWYMLWVLPILVLLPYRLAVITGIVGSFLVLFIYTQYLLNGMWLPSVYSDKLLLLFVALGLGTILGYVRFWRRFL